LLIVVVPVDICVIVVQFPVPSIVTIVLAGRPKVAVVPNIVVITIIVVTVTSGKL